MFEIFLKCSFIFYGCIYTHQRLLNKRMSTQWQHMLNIFISICLAMFICIMKSSFPTLADICTLIILWVILSAITSQPKITFVTTILSFVIAYSMFTLTTGIIFISATLLFEYPLSLLIRYIALLTSNFLALFLVSSLFRIRRFKRGMPFLYTSKNINNVTYFCLVLLAALIYLKSESTADSLASKLLSMALVVSAIFIIMYWWQSQLTQSYLKRIRILEVESLRAELEETNQKMEKIARQNEEFGRLIHKDNKRIPAMENAVMDFLMSSSDPDLQKRGQTLLQDLNAMSRNRTDMLQAISSITSRVYDTGVSAADVMLTFMDKRCQLEHITYSAHITEPLEPWVPSAISADELSHLLSDFLENAIIAVRNCTTRQIHVQMYSYQNHLIIEFADSGIPFDAESLMKFGLEQRTTHLNDGGSGIGLMDIWRIKTIHRASIHITEFREPAPYSKRISFVLDGKNRYLISSWRHDELAALAARTDLHILPEEKK